MNQAAMIGPCGPRPRRPGPRRRRRTGGRRRSRTPLGLEQVGVVRRGIHGDGLRAGERRDGRDDRVFVGRVLVHDRDVALAAIGNVDQLLSRIPAQGVDAGAVRDRRDDFAGAASTTTEVLLQPEKIRLVAVS